MGLGLGNPPLSILDQRYEYQFKPNQTVFRFGNRIFINNWGMRSEPMTERIRPGVRRILVFGDSVIFGGQQVDQSRIAISLFHDRLLKSSYLAEVGNVSAGSWGPGNWKEWAAVHGFMSATDVILVISSHDALDNPTFEPLNPNTHPSRPPASAIGELVDRYLNPERIFYQLRSWRFISQEPFNANAAPSYSGRAPELRRGLSDLTDFLRAAQRSGARVSVLQFWERSEIQEGKPKPEHYAIKSVVESLNIPVYQSNLVFASCSPRPETDLFVDAIHPYTSRGQACLGKAILHALTPFQRTEP